MSYTPEAPRYITPAEALYARSKPYRRILFLELIAWAISHAENADQAEFTEELKQHRLEHWGKRPWPGAKDEAQFLKYVEEMATVFAGAEGAGGAWYPRRKHGPLAGMDLR